MSWQDLKVADYLLIILGIWLALLSFYTIRNLSRFKRLLKNVQTSSQGGFLNGVSSGNINTKQTEDITQAVKKIDAVSSNSFQKYALMRFNPFEDTGGDQSFVVALLDGGNNGVVISSLHSRAGTRVYAKQVLQSKATTHQFSKEEREVVEKAARRSSN